MLFAEYLNKILTVDLSNVLVREKNCGNYDALSLKNVRELQKLVILKISHQEL